MRRLSGCSKYIYASLTASLHALLQVQGCFSTIDVPKRRQTHADHQFDIHREKLDMGRNFSTRGRFWDERSRYSLRIFMNRERGRGRWRCSVSV